MIDRVRKPEEVHLQQAEVLHAAHVELGDDGRLLRVGAGLGLALDGQVVGERLGADHHRRRVYGVLTDEALEPAGDIHHLAHLVVGGVHGAQFGGGGVPVGVLVVAFETGAQRGVAPHDERRHGLGDAVAQRVLLAEHSGRIAHCCPRLDGGEGDDLRDVVVAVLLGGVTDHLVAVAVIEVDVDVGHRNARRVQEPLEQQAVLHGIEIGDAEAVRHHAPGSRASPWPYPDAALAGVADEIPRDEEVAAEAHVGDDPQLIGDARRRVLRNVRAPAPLRPFECQVRQVRVGIGVGCGHLEVRQQQPSELDVRLGPVGDRQRVVARFGKLLEQRPHLCGRLEIVLVAVELEAVWLAAQRPGLHAQQSVVRQRVVLVGVVQVVGGQQRRIEVVRDLQQQGVAVVLCADAVVLQFHVQRIASEDVLQAAGAAAGFVVVAGEQRLLDDAAETPSGGHQPSEWSANISQSIRGL